MKSSVLFGVLMFFMTFPMVYLESYLGIIEHRSITQILVQAAITAPLAAIISYFISAWWERRKARKSGSDN